MVAVVVAVVVVVVVVWWWCDGGLVVVVVVVVVVDHGSLLHSDLYDELPFRTALRLQVRFRVHGFRILHTALSGSCL